MEDAKTSALAFAEEFTRLRKQAGRSLKDLAREASVPPAFVRGLGDGRIPPLHVDGGTLLANRDPRYAAVFVALGAGNASLTSLAVRLQCSEGWKEVLPLHYRIWDLYSEAICRDELLIPYHETFKVFFFDLWDLWKKAAHMRKFAELKHDTLCCLGGNFRILRVGAKRLWLVLRDTQFLSLDDTRAFHMLLLMFTQR